MIEEVVFWLLVSTIFLWQHLLRKRLEATDKQIENLKALIERKEDILQEQVDIIDRILEKVYGATFPTDREVSP